MSQMVSFLETIWKDTDAYVCLAIKDPSGSYKRVFPKWPEQKKVVSDFITAQTAQGKEVYIGPAMWKSKIPPGSTSVKDYFLLSHVLWADMDGNAPEGWPTVQLDGTGGPLPEPTIRIQTSLPINQHLYWLLSEPITDVTVFENKNRTIAYSLSADPGGWDAPQVLRPPDTTNYGIGKAERKGKSYPVFIDSQTETTYDPSVVPVTKDFREVVRESLKEIPDYKKILATHNWDDKFWNTFSKVPEHQNRSDQLMEVAYMAAEIGCTHEEIYSLVQDCDDRWGKYKGRTDRHIRLTDIVERAKDKYPVPLTALTFEGLRNEKEELQTLYTFGAFMSTDIKLDWQFEGLLPVQGYGMIAGPTGVGKSQLGIRLAEKYLIGDEFLGWKNVRENTRKPVMFFSLEMMYVELKQFFQVMSSGGEFLRGHADDMFIVPIGETIPLDRPEGRKFLEAKIEEVRPGLIILDSLSKSMVGNFSSDDVVLEYNRYVGNIRQKYETSVVTVHHNRKSQDKKFLNNELDDLYGSRFLTQDLSFLLMLTKDKVEKNKLDMNLAKVRFSADSGLKKLNRTEDLDFWVERIEDKDDTRGTDFAGSSFLFGESSGKQ